MTISIIQFTGAVGLILVTTAALPKSSKDNSAAAPTYSAPNAASVAPSTSTVAVSSGPGLPADFPLPPGLSPCKPLDASGEIICEWHNVDGHAIYKFYLEALPKAGYTILPGAPKMPPPDYHGPLGLGFKKGTAQGAVTIAGGDLTIQYLPHQ